MGFIKLAQNWYEYIRKINLYNYLIFCTDKNRFMNKNKLTNSIMKEFKDFEKGNNK